MKIHYLEHFRFDAEEAYQQWKSDKLAKYPDSLEEVAIEVEEAERLAHKEKQKLLHAIQRANMAVFRLPVKQSLSISNLQKLGHQLGLTRLDKNLYANEAAISELRVINGERQGEFIPYTNRALHWHTDGYYNAPQKSIHAFILYCQQDSAKGGENELLDPEIAYIYLRDKNPDYIKALMQPDVITIPATVDNGHLVRPQQKSPVFSFEPVTGALHMRYTQRKHNIEWNSDPVTKEALEYLDNLLQGECDHILRYRLQPCEGLICNNVLHNRSAFVDNADKQRVMLRARYYDRITNPN